VGFAVFANQPGRIAPHMQRGTEEIFELFPLERMLGIELALGEAAEETAASLAIGSRLDIKPLEQVVGH
jgi:hypothetical protein